MQLIKRRRKAQLLRLVNTVAIRVYPFLYGFTTMGECVLISVFQIPAVLPCFSPVFIKIRSIPDIGKPIRKDRLFSPNSQEIWENNRISESVFPTRLPPGKMT